MADTKTMRERFKQWAKIVAKWHGQPLELDTIRGAYLWPETQLAWEAWQASDEAAQAVYGVPPVSQARNEGQK